MFRYFKALNMFFRRQQSLILGEILSLVVAQTSYRKSLAYL